MNVKNKLKVFALVSASAMSVQVLSMPEVQGEAPKMEKPVEQRSETVFNAKAVSEDAVAQKKAAKPMKKDWERKSANAQAKDIKLDQHAKLSRVQQRLQEQGYNITSVDGIMGPETKSALEKYQTDNGLESTGRLNQKTLASMNLEFAEVPADAESTSTYSE